MVKQLLAICILVLFIVGCKSEKKEEVVATDCASSPACKESGECTDENGQCVVGSANDCAQSKVCKTQGWCSVTDVGGKRACKP